MQAHQVSRTLVKSPPELWAECSDGASLARHLDGFGGIEITSLQPETTVSWVAEHASGTVRLEPSGWGTKVTLTVCRDIPESEHQEAASSGESAEAAPERSNGARFARMRGLIKRRRVDHQEEAAAALLARRRPQPLEYVLIDSRASLKERAFSHHLTRSSGPEPPLDARAALASALDSLGQAHHRPFSRA